MALNSWNNTLPCCVSICHCHTTTAHRTFFCLVCVPICHRQRASRFKNLSTYSFVIFNTSLNRFMCSSSNWLLISSSSLLCTFPGAQVWGDKLWKDWFSFLFSYGTRFEPKCEHFGGLRTSCSWPNLSLLEDISFVCGLGYTPEHNVRLFQWHHGPDLEQH